MISEKERGRKELANELYIGKRMNKLYISYKNDMDPCPLIFIEWHLRPAYPNLLTQTDISKKIKWNK